jgi:hypothetical protein
VHAVHVAVHGVGESCSALMVFARAHARCAGVVVINVATMCMAVVPIFESFYQQGGGSGRGLVACVPATVAAAVAAATNVMDAATAVVATATIPIATNAAAEIATAAIVVFAVVSPATMLLAAAPLAAWAAWVLLLVLDGRRRLAGSNRLTQHLNLSLHSCDVGGGGS